MSTVNAPVPTPAKQTPTVVIQHPQADPSHPQHASFLARLGAGFLELGIATAIYVGTGGVLRVGPLENKHFDIEDGNFVPNQQ